MKNFKFLLLVVVITFLSCEEQMIMIPDPVIPNDNRVMLVEDLTGVNCPPCHDAAIYLDEQIKLLGGKIVAYGVHGKIQADPHSESKYDFRNQDAFDLEQSFVFFGKPAAAFNRVKISDDETAKGKWETWQPFIDAELAKAQVADVFIEATFDEESRQISIDVETIPLEAIAGDINLHVVISESHLIDPQARQGAEKVLDFDHKHVMKASLTSIPGGDLIATDMAQDEGVSRAFTYTLPEQNNGEWIPENMEITAYITAASRNDEVQQAAQILLMQ